MATAIDQLVVYADWDRDAGFVASGSNITSRVQSATFSWGFRHPDERIAPPASGTLVLDNNDGAFYVGKTGAAFNGLLVPGVMIMFVAYSSLPIMTLRVRGVQFNTETYGNRTVTLTLSDWYDELMAAIYDPPLTTDTTTGDAVYNALKDGLVAYPYASMWFVMGASLMGVGTKMFDPDMAVAYQAGIETLPYVGDNVDRGEGVSLLAFIDEMCAAEMGGRFMWEPPVYLRDFLFVGRFRFYDRRYVAESMRLDYGRQIDPANILSGSEYTYGDILMNTLEITSYPRKVGAAGTELARSDSPMRLDGQGQGENKSSENADGRIYERTLTLRYRAPDAPDSPCAAVTIIDPVAGEDYIANSLADGTGEDMTQFVGITCINKTNAAEITVTNRFQEPLYITLIKVRGTPMTALQAVKTQAVDAQSVYDYGRAAAQMTIAGIHDTETVQQYANYLVRRRKTPIAGYKSILMWMPDDLDGAYPPFLDPPFTVYRIMDTNTLDSANIRRQVIVGAEHMIDRRSAEGWTVRFYLEDAETRAAWVMGHVLLGVMGVTTVLVF